jgi:hypothetical protein
MPSKLPRRSTGSRTATSVNRGQTLQDFLFGISVFLVTVTLVFGLFPSFLTPFSSGIGAAEKAQADRVSRSMVTNFSVTGERNTINGSELRLVLQKDEATLRERYGLAETASLNVTVRSLEDRRIVRYEGEVMATANPSLNQSAGSSARIITFSNRSSDVCRPACRLVVKVW